MSTAGSQGAAEGETHQRPDVDVLGWLAFGTGADVLVPQSLRKTRAHVGDRRMGDAQKQSHHLDRLDLLQAVHLIELPLVHGLQPV